MKLVEGVPFPEIEGIEFFLAGGAVRDVFMCKKPKDLDFVMLTDYTFDETVQKLKKSGARIYLEKPDYQIILCQIEGYNIDLAFPRVEQGYTDCRHPDHTIRVDDLKLDASRRDFTCNAMFMNDSQIYDYFDGKCDILNKKLKCVGNPRDRFKEDPLRIIRAFRFACTMGFDIDADTYWEMFGDKHLLLNESISIDRIKTEINKGLKADPEKMVHFLCCNNFEMFKILKEKDPNFRFELVNRT